MKLAKILFLAAAVAVFIWSGISPHDRFTWCLETFPCWIGLPLLVFCEKRFRVTPLLFVLVCLHSMILCVGGKYTYAEVPAGFWFSNLMGWTRNHYDRLGHFFQGFEPVILAREILLRNKVMKKGAWLILISVSLCLAFSACYELMEWMAAVFTGDSAQAFLGTQGDVWDTQWDMFMALVGALCGALFLGIGHDRQLKKI